MKRRDLDAGEMVLMVFKMQKKNGNYFHSELISKNKGYLPQESSSLRSAYGRVW